MHVEQCTRESTEMKMQAYTTNGGDAPSLALSSPGLTVRSKPASFIRVQDAEPMYKQRMYSDGQSRRL